MQIRLMGSAPCLRAARTNGSGSHRKRFDGLEEFRKQAFNGFPFLLQLDGTFDLIGWFDKLRWIHDALRRRLSNHRL